MFPKQARYKTRGIEEAIPDRLQDALWAIIDRDLTEGKELDYLQVFELSVAPANGRPVQQVRQLQEQSKRSKLHLIPIIHSTVSGTTVWIIDSGTYCTMLLPEEY